MERYVGLDAHASGCTLGVVSPSGTGVSESRGAKSGKKDAFARAEELRIGALETRVPKGRGKFRRLGHVARAYGLVVRDVVRVKNRLKSVLRSRTPYRFQRRGKFWAYRGLGIVTRSSSDWVRAPTGDG